MTNLISEHVLTALEDHGPPGVFLWCPGCGRRTNASPRAYWDWKDGRRDCSCSDCGVALVVAFDKSVVTVIYPGPARLPVKVEARRR